MDEYKPSNKKENLDYRIKTATYKNISTHLKKCDFLFIPPLSERVNINEYAIKLFEKSITFEAWSDDTLVGLVAAYFNDPDDETGFISSVSVINNYGRMGIASELMKRCIDYAKKSKFKEIKLEVHKNNHAAIRLYKNIGFMGIGKKNSIIQMKLELEP